MNVFRFTSNEPVIEAAFRHNFIPDAADHVLHVCVQFPSKPWRKTKKNRYRNISMSEYVFQKNLQIVPLSAIPSSVASILRYSPSAMPFNERKISHV